MANNVRKLVYGVGINNLPYPIKNCPYYERWRSILCRCYSTKFHNKNKSYERCEICEEWKYSLNFKKWMEEQDWEGKVLDKDILFPGNKIYGPDKCIFVPIEINSLFVKPIKDKKYPLGVYPSKTKNKVDAKISINNKKLFLGSFTDANEAHRVWQMKKIEYLKQLSSLQTNEIIKEKIIDLFKNIENDYINNLETKYT
jgi:hypothetical protein